MATTENERRQTAMEEYRKKLIEHREIEAKLKKSKSHGTNFHKQNNTPIPPKRSISNKRPVREELREMAKEFDKSEEDLKALQSGVGQIVGEVLRQLTEDKCKCIREAFNWTCMCMYSLEGHTHFLLVWVWPGSVRIYVVIKMVSLLVAVIVKANNGPRYVVGCRRMVSREHLFRTK